MFQLLETAFVKLHPFAWFNNWCPYLEQPAHNFSQKKFLSKKSFF